MFERGRGRVQKAEVGGQEKTKTFSTQTTQTKNNSPFTRDRRRLAAEKLFPPSAAGRLRSHLFPRLRRLRFVRAHCVKWLFGCSVAALAERRRCSGCSLRFQVPGKTNAHACVPSTFNLKPLTSRRTLHRSRLPSRPFNINSATCPPSAGRGVEDFFCHWVGVFTRK